MSLKPAKKSDKDKPWMQPRKSKNIMPKPEYHLIVSEGTDTEPAYFKAVKEKINSICRGRIQLEPIGKGDNTIYLFNKALKLAQNSPNVYSHVWVVFDTDDFPTDDIDAVDGLCAEYTTEETTYHSIWSNQCFELWFLLHISYMHSDLHRTEYWDKLSDWLIPQGLGEYDKSREDMFEILSPYMQIAIANAKKLEVQNKGRKPSESAPGTKVHELIEWLSPYL